MSELERYLLVRGKNAALRIRLGPFGVVTIGSGRVNDLVIDEEGVEDQHVALHFDSKLMLEVVSGEATVENGGGATRLGRGVRQTFESQDRLRIGSLIAMVCPVEAATNSRHIAARSFVAHSETMRAVLESAERLAKAPGNVLILGETGTGKGLLAQRIHDMSDRADRPFIRRRCVDLVEAALDEAVLLGARGGTVLLDEVGGLSERAQLSLGHLIEGDRNKAATDVRFVFTSNHDLQDDVKAGRLRKDLYFRLSRASLVIPPLRERADDIVPMAEHFLAEAARATRRSVTPSLTDGARTHLRSHGWPGNVRELQHVVERALLQNTGESLAAEDFVLDETDTRAAPDAPASDEPQSLREEMAALERKRIIEALDRYPTQTEAAKALDIPLRTFLNRLDALGIPRARKSKK